MNTATPQPDSDVLIIGGGPAGSPAAIVLARGGLANPRNAGPADRGIRARCALFAGGITSPDPA